MSVSRIQSPADRVAVGQTLTCAVKSRDVQGRLVLTLRELLGTWQENADRFRAGGTVVGLVRSVEIDLMMFGRETDPMAYLWAALLTAGFSLLVNGFGYRKMRKIDMVESLKSAE